MKNQNTSKPDPIPEFRSSTDHRGSEELPAEENLNDQPKDPEVRDTQNLKPDLGNDPDADEKEREKLITP